MAWQNSSRFQETFFTAPQVNASPSTRWSQHEAGMGATLSATIRGWGNLCWSILVWHIQYHLQSVPCSPQFKLQKAAVFSAWHRDLGLINQLTIASLIMFGRWKSLVLLVDSNMILSIKIRRLRLILCYTMLYQVISHFVWQNIQLILAKILCSKDMQYIIVCLEFKTSLADPQKLPQPIDRCHGEIFLQVGAKRYR